MEEELNFNSILGREEINDLFLEDSTEEEGTTETDNNENNSSETDDDNTTEVDPLDLFEEEPESVGSEEDNQEKEKVPDSEKELDSSSNFYSSIAKAFKEDGIFPDLEDNNIDDIKTPEDFAEFMEKQIQYKLEEKQKRVDEALNAGVEPSEIKQYEDTISYLNSLTKEVLAEESDKSETLRKQLIYQDFINRGYSKERAEREVKKSLNAGTDIDDAKESLASNKEYFQSEYDSLIKEHKRIKDSEVNERKEQAELLKKSILNEDKVFGDIEVDKATRQKVFDTISKPIYKDPKTGELFTAIQKYERDNKTEFLKNVGLLYTLTDGFKDITGVLKNKVNKEVKKGLRKLESTLNNTSRTSDGNLKFVSGVSEDSESIISKGWEIDV